MFLHFPINQTHYRGKSEKSKPNGGSSTSAFANEVADAFGGQSRSVPWMISSITCKQERKKIDNVQFDLVNESRNYNRKRVEREWEITVIGAGDGVEGLEGWDWSRRWLQRLLLHYTPRNGLHLCCTSVTERERESVGWEEEVLEGANLRILCEVWISVHRSWDWFLVGFALNFLGFWADPIRYMIICLYKKL